MTLVQLQRAIQHHAPGLMDVHAHYGVLVPVVEGPEGLSLLFEVRASTLSHQPNEVCFPGGKVEPGETPEAGDEDPESGLVPLGDMCISLERAAAQAAEFGHSVERELSYLTVHSVLHLLGYDHMDEGPMKRQMRVHEEFILDKLGITREMEEETP